MESRTAAFFKAVTTILSREQLGEDPLRAPTVKQGFFTWLFASEELPKAAVSVPPPREGFLTWLFKPDPLPPPEGEVESSKASIFAVIFGRDDLSRVPVSDGEAAGDEQRNDVPDGNAGTDSAGER